MRVVAEATAWPEVADRPIRAAVSAFSVSGTNAHVVLEGYEPGGEAGAAVPVAGAPAAAADAAAAGGRRGCCRSRPGAGRALAELAAGTGNGWRRNRRSGRRNAWRMRRGPPEWGGATSRCGRPWSSGRRRALREQLRLLHEGGAERRAAAGGASVAFLYPGQGSQGAGMGRDLYAREPAARAVLDRLEAVFREERGESLLSVMFGDAGSPDELDRTSFAQPALFALSAALTALWRGVGVVPVAVLGCGEGELAAAAAAGGIELEAGMRFAARRGALLESLPPGGGMAAVFAPVERVRPLLSVKEGSDLSLAVENGVHCVVSGPVEALAALEARMEEAGTRTERLPAGQALHSPLVDPVLAALEAAADELGWRGPAIPLVSGVTGRELGADEALDGAYWRRQARSPVRFATGMRTLADRGWGWWSRSVRGRRRVRGRRPVRWPRVRRPERRRRVGGGPDPGPGDRVRRGGGARVRGGGADLLPGSVRGGTASASGAADVSVPAGAVLAAGREALRRGSGPSVPRGAPGAGDRGGGVRDRGGRGESRVAGGPPDLRPGGGSGRVLRRAGGGGGGARSPAARGRRRRGESGVGGRGADGTAPGAVRTGRRDARGPLGAVRAGSGPGRGRTRLGGVQPGLVGGGLGASRGGAAGRGRRRGRTRGL